MPGGLGAVEAAGDEHEVWSRAPRARMVSALVGMQSGGSWIQNATVIQKKKKEHGRLKTSPEGEIRVRSWVVA